MAEERKAVITASAYQGIARKRMTDAQGIPIVEQIECSTDIPADALGEVTARVLQIAWKTGVDPVVDKVSIHIELTFS